MKQCETNAHKNEMRLKNNNTKIKNRNEILWTPHELCVFAVKVEDRGPQWTITTPKELTKINCVWTVFKAADLHHHNKRGLTWWPVIWVKQRRNQWRSLSRTLTTGAKKTPSQVRKQDLWKGGRSCLLWYSNCSFAIILLWVCLPPVHKSRF